LDKRPPRDCRAIAARLPKYRLFINSRYFVYGVVNFILLSVICYQMSDVRIKLVITIKPQVLSAAFPFLGQSSTLYTAEGLQQGYSNAIYRGRATARLQQGYSNATARLQQGYALSPKRWHGRP